MTAAERVPDGDSCVVEEIDDVWDDSPERAPRILFLGDVHGDGDWFDQVVEAAVSRECDTIVQCGDFGYWEHTNDGKDFLDSVARTLHEHMVTCVWIDGNHENHSVLRANYGPGGGRHNVTDEGFWIIRPGLLYAPRGHRWTWHGVSFLALGGAYSIDKEWRKAGKSWWPEETITDDEEELAIAGGPADVMVTHDAPADALGTIPANGTWDRQKDAWPESRANRERVQRVVDAVQPKLLVHGHYHHPNDEVLANGTRVRGLGMNGDPQALMLTELSEVRG